MGGDESLILQSKRSIPNATLKVIGNRPTGGERARVMDASGIHPALSSTDYKQPIAVALEVLGTRTQAEEE